MEIDPEKNKIALVACSNGFSPKDQELITNLKNTLADLTLDAVLSKHLFKSDGSIPNEGEQKAIEFNNFVRDDSIKAIFDISGGDTANLTLDYIDFQLIRKKKTFYFGYSDNSVLLNAIAYKSRIPTFHYCLRNIVLDESRDQLAYFKNNILNNELVKISFQYEYMKGHNLRGMVFGGNLRCFLKLAQTRFFPNLKKKVLFLESYGGNEQRISSYLQQIRQMGVFRQIKGLILGNFTELHSRNGPGNVKKIILSF